MKSGDIPYQIFPLGDSAITVDFGNRIEEALNKEVISRFIQLQQNPLPGMIEAVPAYSSFTIHYDLFELAKITPVGLSVYEWMQQQLTDRLNQPADHEESIEKVVNIPVCYDNAFAPDIKYLAATNNISVDEIIQIHSSKKYKVYMLGFLPGFCYMGEVDDRIAISRKPQPMNVVTGSVGIAGRQTGIYPMASPGGWQIIGRSPVQLFDGTKEEPTLLKAGDIVQFHAINKKEFESLMDTEATKK